MSSIAEDFLRLREALIPYTYTLAAQAHNSGMPMTQPLYLDYPNQPAAYAYPGEYLYGSDVLVAPVTSPGTRPTPRCGYLRAAGWTTSPGPHSPGL